MCNEMVEQLQKIIREAPLSMVPALFIVLTEEVVNRKALTDRGIVKIVTGVIEKSKSNKEKT